MEWVVGIIFLAVGLIFLVNTFAKPKSDKEMKNVKWFLMHKKGARIGGVIFLILGVVVLFGGGSSEIKVEGDTAKIEKIIVIKSLSTAAYQVAEDVYSAATKHPNIKRVIVDLKMSGSGISDKYGNPVSGNLEMGQILINDLDEVRKYKDQSTYTYNNENHEFYKNQVKLKPYSYLLDK